MNKFMNKTKKSLVSLMLGVLVVTGLFGVSNAGTAEAATSSVNSTGMSSLTCDSVKFWGYINTGSASSTYPVKAWFEYGTNENEVLYGSANNIKTPQPPFGPYTSAFQNIRVEQPVTGLTPQTTYHMNLVASMRINGTWYDVRGNYVDTFTTPACPVTAKYTVTSSATVGGFISPNGAQTVNEGKILSFYASPNKGYSGPVFGGTCGGNSSGNNYTTKPITKDCSVTATFTKAPAVTYTLSVNKIGKGFVNGSGINCGGACQITKNAGETVSLSASPDNGYTFSGWSGACSGTGSCSVTMNSNKSVTATFNVLKPNATLTVYPENVSYNGNAALTWNSKNATSCQGIGFDTAGAVSGKKVLANLTATKTYKVTCTGEGGSASAEAMVTVGNPANPSVDFYATPNPVDYGKSATLSWSSKNATVCTAFGAWSGKKGISGTASTGALTYTKTYTIKCEGNYGTNPAVKTVRVEVNPEIIILKPTVSLTAFPESIQYGGYSALKWTSKNADSCTSNDFATGGAVNGSKVVSPSSTETYTITCTGEGGSAEDSATITVGAPSHPAVSFSANPYKIYSGESSTLAWSSSKAKYCVAGGAWAGKKGISGSASTGELYKDSTYSIVCYGADGTTPARAELTVRVIEKPEPPKALPKVDLRVNGVNGPVSIPHINEGATLTWTSENADRCETLNGANGWQNQRNWKTEGEFQTGSLQSGKTFRIICHNSAGSATDTVRIIVEDKICAPTATLNATKRSEQDGGGYILRWSSTYADSCKADWTNSTAPEGKKSVHPDKTTTYKITCTGPGGTVTAYTTVNPAN